MPTFRVHLRAAIDRHYTINAPSIADAATQAGDQFRSGIKNNTEWTITDMHAQKDDNPASSASLRPPASTE